MKLLLSLALILLPITLKAGGLVFSPEGGQFVGTSSHTLVCINGDCKTAWPTGGGGGVTVSTFVVDLHSGGDVFVASGTMISNIGMAYVTDFATITITGVKCYTIFSSSFAPTAFNILISTDTGSSSDSGQYLFTAPISVAQNVGYRTMYSAWETPDTIFGELGVVPYALSLQTVSVPAQEVGTAMPSEYGCMIKYWRRLD